MKTPDALNMLAMMADAEARSTAQLVEMIAAAVLVKLAPPEGEAVAELVLTQADLNQAMQDFYSEAEYSEDGTMTLHLTRVVL
jgi:hypothetical protein